MQNEIWQRIDIIHYYTILNIHCFVSDSGLPSIAESDMAEAFPVICIKPDEDAADCYTGDSGGKIVQLIGYVQSFIERCACC